MLKNHQLTLKFQITIILKELCGHVLEIDCGYGPLDIIVTNSNYGGGLGKNILRVLNLIFFYKYPIRLRELVIVIMSDFIELQYLDFF